MAQFYTIKEISKLGEPWESHGKSIQTWWGFVEEEELAISVGKQVGNELTAGQSIYGDLMKAVSKKGNEYWKFKSVQVPEGVKRPASTTISNNSLEARVRALEDKVFGGDTGQNTPTIKDTYPPVADSPVVDDFEQEPIDLNDIPF